MCLVTSVVNAQATGTISGTVTDTGGTGLSGVGVQIYDASGSFAGFGSTDGTGQYTLGGLPTGTYFARTFASSAGYINELYNDLPCFPSCDVTTGTPIAVTTGATTSGVDFALALGGTINGTVTDTGGTGVSGVFACIYDASGSQVNCDGTDGAGQYTAGGLPTGTYFTRTLAASFAGYIDELYDDLPCFTFCDVTTGTPIAVAGRGDDERDRLRPCPYRGDADPRGAHHGAARSDRRPACQPVPVDGRSNHP